MSIFLTIMIYFIQATNSLLSSGSTLVIQTQLNILDKV